MGLEQKRFASGINSSPFSGLCMCVCVHARKSLRLWSLALPALQHEQPRTQPSTSQALLQRAPTLRNASFSQNRESRVIPWDRSRNSKARPGFAMLENQEQSWAVGSCQSSSLSSAKGRPDVGPSSGSGAESPRGPHRSLPAPQEFRGDASSPPSRGWPASKTHTPKKPFLQHNICANTVLTKMPLTRSHGKAGGTASISHMPQDRLEELARPRTLGCL